MALTPASTTSGPKFDPTQFNESDMSKRNGKFVATDYQAALEARNFIKQHEKDLPGGKLTYQNIWEGASSGAMGANGKSIELTDKQKAAFEKLAADDFALFNRMDAGSTGKKDNSLTISEIQDSIKDPKKLHGSQASKDGHWTDPTGSTTGPQAKETLSNYFKEQFGDDWKDVSLKTIAQLANNGRYYDQAKKDWVDVDDPKVIQAAAWLHRNSGEVDKGGMNSLGLISREEFDNWNKV